MPAGTHHPLLYKSPSINLKSLSNCSITKERTGIEVQLCARTVRKKGKGLSASIRSLNGFMELRIIFLISLVSIPGTKGWISWGIIPPLQHLGHAAPKELVSGRFSESVVHYMIDARTASAGVIQRKWQYKPWSVSLYDHLRHASRTWLSLC